MEEWSDGVVFLAGATLLTISLGCLSYVLALYVQVARDSGWIGYLLLGDVRIKLSLRLRFSEGGNHRRPIITVSPLSETVGPKRPDGTRTDDDGASEDACRKEMAHEVTVVVEHRAEAEALCNGSNEAMPTTDDKTDPTPSTSAQPTQNGQSETQSGDPQQPSDSSKRNTITEDWTIKDNVESGDEACCTRLSQLIHRKAKELSTHLTKPPKPLKPSKESKKPVERTRSFGDEIPGGRHGIRYADEDTEASSDYQDVDLSKLAVADVTTAAVHKPVVEENEYEVVEAPREEVKPTPLPVAPIMVIIEDKSTTEEGPVPEATQKKTRSLEKPKRPPPPKPEAAKKPRVRRQQKRKEARQSQSLPASRAVAAETGAVSEKAETPEEKVPQGTSLEKPVLVRVMEREEPSPVLSSKMPKSMFPSSSPVKKVKPLRPPPPKIPVAASPPHPSCSPPPPPSSPPHSEVATTSTPAENVSPESSAVKVTTVGDTDDAAVALSAASNVGGTTSKPADKEKDVPTEVPSCAPVSKEPVIESKVATSASETAAEAPKPVQVPRKKRTPPPRPPPPKCKLKPAEVAPETATKPAISPKPSLSTTPTQKSAVSPVASGKSSVSPVQSGSNVYSQTDDLVAFRAKNIVADLDALLAQKEAEEAARAKNVLCIEASLKTMAREAAHQFQPSEASKRETEGNGKGEVPQAPPRKRRQRSRTVEAVRVSGEEQARRLRRSHSLTEADIRIKAAQRLERDNGSDVAATITETFVMVLESPITKKELKDLYTNVTVVPAKERRFKEVPRPNPATGMRFRPLPAPPPPPRGKSKAPAPPLSPSPAPDSSSVQQEASTTGDVPPVATQSSEAIPSEPAESEVVPDTVELRASPAKSDTSKRLEKSDSLSGRSTKSGSPAPKVRWENGEAKEFRLSNSTFYGPPLEIPPEAQRGAESPCTEPNASSEKSRSSWYDDSDASGDVADVDSPAVPSDTDPMATPSRKSDSSPGSVHRSKTRQKEKKRSSAKFYCDVEAERESSTDGDVPRVSSRASGSDRVLETAETKGEDTDELLEMAEGLQKEMTKVLVERQKRLLESFDSELSAQRAESECREEQRLAAEKDSPSLMPRKDLPSVHSSASEVSWQGSSEEESDGEETRHMSLDDAARHRRKRKCMYIARELASSEKVFVDALHLLNRDFRDAVHAASEERGSPIVPDEVLEQILNHLPHLVDLNQELLGQLQERVDNWEKLRLEKLAVKCNLSAISKPKFSSTRAAQLRICCASEYRPKEWWLTFPFPFLLQQSPRCKQLSLQQYMLKPIQRIPQYRLLLNDYVKNLEEGTPEYGDACNALAIVSQVAEHANESMKLGDNFCKLMLLQNKISNRYEVLKPGRTFLKEGELMKVSRKEMQPRYFVLFSDSLLYLVPTPQGFLRVNYELPLSGMKVMVPPQQDYQNEFSVYTTKRSFILSASSPEEREEWISALNTAIQDNIHRKSSFHEGSQSSSSSELGREAPVWIPDQRVTMCQLCTSGFTFTHRRHHCRACGKVVCAACSAHRVALPYLGGDKPVRVCDHCFHSLHHQVARHSFLLLQEVAANDLGSSMSGYLHQWWKKAWKRQWFVIKEHVLYVYRASEDVAALRTVPLLGFQVGTVQEGFEEVPRDRLFLLEHMGLDPLVFYADTPALAARSVAIALAQGSFLYCEICLCLFPFLGWLLLSPASLKQPPVSFPRRLLRVRRGFLSLKIDTVAHLAALPPEIPGRDKSGALVASERRRTCSKVFIFLVLKNGEAHVTRDVTSGVAAVSSSVRHCEWKREQAVRLGARVERLQGVSIAASCREAKPKMGGLISGSALAVALMKAKYKITV
ncbi:hypothetical protein HPB48_005923 [Haemaphysalis longicornis]|uniref:Uncharacterized protein n=1 Tax=Haemaphysalis longicornis TaxID=44386 RepID=A0A9J6FM95_HAELO|nr:hypothetical protein HPB48_005923 [Haemaphysalis longicornis]